MTDPIASVVRTANTPSQAKVWAALLQAEGIPARVDGDVLADEIAVSMRVMNRSGVKVLVPTSSLARANEILDAAHVDEAELERQALAAEDPERAPERPAVAPARTATRPYGAMVAAAAAIVFFALWRGEVDQRLASEDPHRRFEMTDTGYREFRAADGVWLSEGIDENRDRLYERVVLPHPSGEKGMMWDGDHDLRYERVERPFGGLVYVFFDDDKDGFHERAEVRDRDGKVVQSLLAVAGKGFELLGTK